MTIPLYINTLFFDFDGTLAHQQPSSLDVLFTILDEHGIPLMAAAHRDTMQFIYQYWGKSDQVNKDLKEFGEFTHEFWIHYLEKNLLAAGLPESEASKIAPIIQPIFNERYQPVKAILDDVKPTLRSLRTSRYSLGLISNRSNPIDDELEELGFTSYFDFYFTAGEIDSWKPDQEVFEHGLYLAGSLAEETAYIGDNYYTDIVGAKNAGLYPILYDPRNIFPDADCQVITNISDLCS
jgi:HAD superfamily hydrolase (TIGR01549 family)